MSAWVQAIYRARELAGDYVLPLAAAEQIFSQQLDFQVYVKLASGVSRPAGRQPIENVLHRVPDREADGPHRIGVANPLALSIH